MTVPPRSPRPAVRPAPEKATRLPRTKDAEADLPKQTRALPYFRQHLYVE